jgi:hypothetical protein
LADSERTSLIEDGGSPPNAPDIGAFYFEDALAAVAESGGLVGDAEFTLPPRQSGEAAALTAEYRKCIAEMPAGAIAGRVPPRKFRVVRFKARRVNDIMTYDLLLTVSRELPPRADSPGGGAAQIRKEGDDAGV